MGLLHKNLILAGIASVAMVGVLGSSSVSALDGFSFWDIINQQQAQIEQLLSYSTNPFDTSTACESTNPDSTISCNESPFPSLLFNRISDGEKLWGHDGKGIVFADSENLINGNPQLKTAKRGDTLTFSVKLEAEDYYDAAETDPITEYQLVSLISSGLDVDLTSVQLKVNGQVTPLDSENVLQVDFEDTTADLAAMGADFAKQAMIKLQWFRDDGFLYPENSVIEVVYSATITDDAPSEVFSRVAYVGVSQSGQEILSFASPAEILSGSDTSSQATALLDGNILIRRVDANGNPLAGAKYTIDGVKASIKDETDNMYELDDDGAVSAFTTNSDGVVIVSGLPIGKYTVREIYSPNGHPVESNTIEKEIVDSTTTIEYGETKWKAYLFGEFDLTRYVNNPISIDDGRILVPTEYLNDSGDFVYQYSESEGGYYNRERGSTITKNGDTYHLKEGGAYGSFEHDFIYDSSLGKLVSHRSWLDVFGKRATSMYDYLEFDGAQARIVDAGSQYTLTYDDDGGLYSGTSSSGTLVLKKDGNEYRLENGYNSIPYVLDPESGKYLKEFDVYVYVLESVTDSEIVVKPYYVMSYSPAFGHYYICFGFNDQAVVNDKRDQLRVSEFLFQDKANNEDIPNPQTSDAVLKAIIIAGIGLVSILVLRKQLTKRAN